MANYHFIGGDGKSYGPYSAEQMREYMAQNRLTAQSQVSADGGPLQPASSYPELMGGAGAPEGGAPTMTGAPQPMAVNPALAQSRVKGPATFMLVLGIICLVLAPISVVYQFTQGQEAYNDLPPELRDLVLKLSGTYTIASNALSFIANILIVVGSLKMKKLESYGLAVTASILCIICDWGCCCLGIGAGIWSIVVLFDAQVKAAFR